MEKHTELIAALHRGDPKALSTLYKLYDVHLRYFAYQLLHQEQDAYAVVNTAFQKLWEKRETLLPDANIRAYLYMTVRNHCYDLLRSRKINQIDYPEHAPNEAIQPAMDILALDRARLLDEVSKQVDRLPHLQRTVWQLLFEENKTYEEIAVILQTSVGSVRNAKHVAIHKMQQHFLQKYPTLNISDFFTLLIMAATLFPKKF